MSGKEAQIQAVKNLQKSYPKSPIYTLSAAQLQALFSRPRPVKGPVWLAQETLGAPIEKGLVEILWEAIDYLNTDSQVLLPNRSTLQAKDSRLEWLGPRPGVEAWDEQPAISEAQKFCKLEQSAQNYVTVLYVNGGAFYFGSPSSSRPMARAITDLTRGRIASVAYRLAPQNPFPAALLDVFMAYTSLLSPPPGSLHGPVDPHSIVLAGESAGGNLCLGLVQLLLKLRRKRGGRTRSIRWHNTTVPLLLPAGIVTMSFFADLSHSLPSYRTNGATDFLTHLQANLLPGYPSDDIWPSRPPRADVYGDMSLVLHPLASPIMALDWSDAPPLFVAASQGERLLDGMKMVASRAAQQGVAVRWEEYEGMPHSFAKMLPRLPQAQVCLRSLATACQDFAGGWVRGIKGEILKMPDCGRRNIDVGNMAPLTREEAIRPIKKGMEARTVWTGKQSSKSSL